MGIKPLYYYLDKNRFIFSSEIRAILSSNLVKKKLSRSSLVEYLKYQTVQNSKTIIQNIYSVPPASYSIIKKELNLSFHKYWNISDIKPKTFHDNENDIKNKVFNSLKSSVSKRMFSDVDSGVFLSGGLDSSILVGLMRSISNKQINTFNVSFDETEFSESKYAKLIAKKFNTQHVEIKLSPQIFLDNIKSALDDMDHPSGDGVNSWVVSKYTKKQM